MTKRDIAEEILEGIREIKAGKGRKIEIDTPDNVYEIRRKMNLTQASFAAFMGVSVRTLQEWEQGRRHPSGPAYSLLRIAKHYPEAFKVL